MFLICNTINKNIFACLYFSDASCNLVTMFNYCLFFLIQGSGLGRVDQTDYVVDVGEGECEITEIFDNLIICEPPPDIKQTGDDTEISRQRLVKVGFSALQ